MRILVACEESQVVTTAFRTKGHEAYSCDIQDCSGGHPEWHIKDDVLKHLTDGWDLMIAHPPCTYLAVSGAAWFDHPKYPNRRFDQLNAIEFFLRLAKADIEKVCVENPIGVINTFWRKPDQIIQPYNFGEPYSKSTCLWLKNLPKLVFDCIEAPLFGEELNKGEFVTYESGVKMPKWYAEARTLPKEERQSVRSKTFQGIANAMAEQWGSMTDSR